jgi:hypothetical protein
MSRFHVDDSEQKKVRDAVLGPGLYGPMSLDGRYVYIDKGNLATILQKRFAVDTVFQGKSNAGWFVEEKIVRWQGYPYTKITLETESCTVPGHESDGWMRYGEADWLNYAMCQENGNVLCRFINFRQLKEKFWATLDENPDLWPETISKQHNRTACRKVPLSWIEKNVGIHPCLVHATPEGAEIVKAYNAGHYMANA